MTRDDIIKHIHTILKQCEFEFDEDDGFTFGNHWKGTVSSMPHSELRVAEIFEDFGHSLQEELVCLAIVDLTKAQKRELLWSATNSNDPSRLSLYLRPDIHDKVFAGLKNQNCINFRSKPNLGLGWGLNYWGTLLARELLEQKRRAEAA